MTWAAVTVSVSLVRGRLRLTAAISLISPCYVLPLLRIVTAIQTMLGLFDVVRK